MCLANGVVVVLPVCVHNQDVVRHVKPHRRDGSAGVECAGQRASLLKGLIRDLGSWA